MKTSKMVVGKEFLGVVRKGFSGATAVLEQERNDFHVRFLCASGKTKKICTVKVGHEYVIGPDWLKRLPPLEEDTYWPRRWSREFGKGCSAAHTSFFKILNEGEFYQHMSEYAVAWSQIPCPKTLERRVIHPLNSFSYAVALVNKAWLATVSYAEFCEAMNR